jgi:hypothetical protein
MPTPSELSRIEPNYDRTQVRIFFSSSFQANFGPNSNSNSNFPKFGWKFKKKMKKHEIRNRVRSEIRLKSPRKLKNMKIRIWVRNQDSKKMSPNRNELSRTMHIPSELKRTLKISSESKFVFQQINSIRFDSNSVSVTDSVLLL